MMVMISIRMVLTCYCCVFKCFLNNWEHGMCVRDGGTHPFDSGRENVAKERGW